MDISYLVKRLKEETLWYYKIRYFSSLENCHIRNMAENSSTADSKVYINCSLQPLKDGALVVCLVRPRNTANLTFGKVDGCPSPKEMAEVRHLLDSPYTGLILCKVQSHIVQTFLKDFYQEAQLQETKNKAKERIANKLQQFQKKLSCKNGNLPSFEELEEAAAEYKSLYKL